MPVAQNTRQIELAADETVQHLISQLPFDSQDSSDSAAAEHYALQLLYSRINSRLSKLDDSVKDAVRSGTLGLITETKSYERTCELGTPRTLFNKDLFIDLVATEFPSIPKHKLRELANDQRSYKASAAPVSISYEYKG